MDCSKLNEIFNIDGPYWIEDDEDIIEWVNQTREEKLKKQRARYADGGLERKREYKERDGVREMLRKSDREWCDKNKERINERRRELYVENREKIREQKKAIYQKHKEKNQQRAREYYWNKKQRQKKAI